MNEVGIFLFLLLYLDSLESIIEFSYPLKVVMEGSATTESPPLAIPKCEYKIFDCYFYRNDCEFNPRQRRGDRQNIEYYIERIHEQVCHLKIYRDSPYFFITFYFFF